MAYVQVESDDVSTSFVSLIQHNCLLYQPIATSRRRSGRSPIQMYARFFIRSWHTYNLTAPIAFLGADATAHGISNPPRAAGVGNTDRRKSSWFDMHRWELMLLEFRIPIWWVQSTQGRRKLLDGWILPTVLWCWHTNRTPLGHTRRWAYPICL